MVKSIGGYFSLELPYYGEYHKEAKRLNTGRNCFEYILRVRGYKKIFVPYYTCDVVLEPLRKLGIEYEFYHVNICLELEKEFYLGNDEALLYTNYYGLKQRYVEKLAEKYKQKLIVDNTQAFFARPIGGIDSFYTCRKFFGVPDGAYLYCGFDLKDVIEQDFSYNRVLHLVKRIDLSAEEGFADFRKVDEGLEGQPIKCMSKLTQRMMCGIDYEKVAKRRRKNYQILDSVLGSDNMFKVSLEEDAVPMVYPYFTNKELRGNLIDNKIFVARYWPNVLEWTDNNDIENNLALQMLPLPIDQRYGKNEMNFIINKIM